MSSKTKFARWVDEYGGSVLLAARLRVTPAVVRLWVRGGGSPRAMTIQRIVDLSAGKLTYSAILRDTRSNMKRSKAPLRVAAKKRKRKVARVT